MGGRGASFGLDNSGRGNGGIREPKDYADVQKSSNPFKQFKTYQREFDGVKTVEQLRTLLDKNGVSMNDNLYNAIKSGKINLNTAKEFMQR